MRMILMACIALALLAGCRNRPSEVTEREVERAEEARGVTPRENGTTAPRAELTPPLLSPRMAPEAEGWTPSGEIVDGVRVVRLTARRYAFDPVRIVVRQGERIRLDATSEDVAHGLAIWGYGIDQRLEPGKTEAMTFTADRPGQFHYACSVYCGAGCVEMRGDLYVQEAERPSVE